MIKIMICEIQAIWFILNICTTNATNGSSLFCHNRIRRSLRGFWCKKIKLAREYSLLPLLPCTWTLCGGKTKTHLPPSKKINFSLNSVDSHAVSQLARLPRTSFCCFLHVVFTWRIKSSDRKRPVLFPLNVKQSPNLG